LGLVDAIRTSDDYLVSHYDSADVFSVRHHGKRRLADKVSETLTKIAYNVALKLWTDLDQNRFGKA
jgi:serine protease SohB